VHAIIELRRFLKPSGILAARESDFPIMTWYPSHPPLTRWKKLWIQVARANGGEPDAGRRVHAWARQAGFDPRHVTSSAGTWFYREPEEIEWWTSLWAKRVTASTFKESAIELGVSTRELEEIADGWREWAKEVDAWFVLVHGEIIARKMWLLCLGARHRGETARNDGFAQ
jgi:hypothetical protein